MIKSRSRLTSAGNSARRLAVRAVLCACLIAAGAAGTTVSAIDLPAPPPASDFQLIEWDKVVAYCRAIESGSKRVVVRELGQSTEGRPFIVACISDEKTIQDLEAARLRQAKLVDPRVLLDEHQRAQTIAAGKPVVLITCTIHSTETASTFMALRLIHELAARDDADTRSILENVIILLVPSVNPDGVDKVARWYERSKGHPWEGSGMPELYHKYAGHDTNRDFFMLNLVETRLLSRLLYREWFPTITYDVHEMGSRGARLFVPPFYDPINPNLDPRIEQSIALVGAHMAADLAQAGKQGVLTRAIYDNWWNGGNRTTPQRHNMVGVLTEAASVRMATPMFLTADDLRGNSRGFPDHAQAINFVDPWPGGWWRLSDITEYEYICARSLLTLAARYPDRFQKNFALMSRDAIEKGRLEPPFAWVVPADQRDAGAADRMMGILHETGVSIEQAVEPFEAAGQSFPAGSQVLRAAQPFRAHLKDLMERQVYPARFDAKGDPEPPYDVAGWTLPLQLGVRVVEVAETFAANTKLWEEPLPRHGRIEQAEGASAAPAYYAIDNSSNDDFTVLQALLNARVPVWIATDQTSRGSAGVAESTIPITGSLVFEASDGARRVLDDVLPRVSTVVRALGAQAWGDGAAKTALPTDAPRVALYQPWVPSMDEGWTRYVLDRHGLAYRTLHNAEIRSGDLKSRIDVLILPSVSAKVLRGGFGPSESEPAYVGGLDRLGSAAILEFVRAGGTLVCLEDSCLWAIDELGLSIKEITHGLKPSEYYAPGSLLRVRYARDNTLTIGMPVEGASYVDRSLAFQVEEETRDVAIAARYADTPELLESGWLLGAKRIAGQAAVVSNKLGEGRVILFGFPPQHRGQTLATFRLLFNAILLPGRLR